MAARKRRKRNKRKHRKWLIRFLVLVCMATVAYLLHDNATVLTYAGKIQSSLKAYFGEGSRSRVNAFKMTESNYGSEVEEIAEKYDLPAAYLKALIVLECSGKKPVKPRYEKHIFIKLKKVRDQKGRTFEHITQDMISDASDEALKNLSKSWGPFQLMGYKCLHLDVKVNDIRGDDALDWGAKWIKMEYGHLLKKKRFADAFHYHNTGRLYPKDSITTTHDPKYVDNGIKYIAYFN